MVECKETVEWRHTCYLIDGERKQSDELLKALLERFPAVHFRVVLSDRKEYKEVIVCDASYANELAPIHWFVAGFTAGWVEGKWSK